MMEFHPLADIFPMMGPEEYAGLKADIAEYGLREAIILAEGKIADGRNRYNACMELSVAPEYEEWDGIGSLLAFIISMNLHRRHLNESQRAMVAARLANMKQGERTDLSPIGERLSQQDSADMLNVGKRSVERAAKVLTSGTPELAQAVERGEVAVSVAATVAKMPEEQQKAVMEKVAEGKKPKTAMREVKHEQKRAQPFPTGKYQVIYADPPWKYDNTGFDESADEQYPTQTIEEICAWPVETLATDATVLFLWATNPLLPEALVVMKAWGFQYKTNFVWVKDAGPSIGWWSKSKHEPLLIGVRKNTPQPAVKVSSVIEAKREQHSKKPEVAYDLIEQMYPGNKVELFGRKERTGWDIWGNEI